MRKRLLALLIPSVIALALAVHLTRSKPAECASCLRNYCSYDMQCGTYCDCEPVGTGGVCMPRGGY